jgi:hypothetical protein
MDLMTNLGQVDILLGSVSRLKPSETDIADEHDHHKSNSNRRIELITDRQNVGIQPEAM